MKKLIASDYDGTFCRVRVFKNDIKKVDHWRKNGGKFGFVTGRGYDFTNTLKDNNITFDFLILYNGSLILDSNLNTIFESFIDDSVISELEKYFDNNNSVRSYDRSDGKPKHKYYATCDTFRTALSIAEMINNDLSDYVTAFVNGVHVNCAAKGSSKADGIRFILNYYGYTSEEAAVVGDDYNDIGMISEYNGWAVINSKKAVRKQASHICFSVGTLISKLIKKVNS